MTGQESTDQQLLVRRATLEAERILSIELVHPEGRELPPWQPGAHLDVVCAAGLVRQYSLCGAASDRQRYRIAVLREDGGRGGSLELHRALRIGGLLSVRGPRNLFPLHPAPAYLFLAGGIGVTPILSMVDHAASVGVPWHLLYGGRSSGSMPFVAELATRTGGTLEVLEQDRHGLPDLGGALHAAPPAAGIYACGPPAMLTAIEQLCSERNVSGRLHLERFTAAESTADSTSRTEGPFEVVLGRSGVTRTVPVGQTLLEAIEDVAPILSSCREGYCGTCETRVLEGIPDHRDTVLTAAERASGAVIMPCVSRSLTPSLTLDI